MADSDLLRVTRIRVSNLFGRYDHEVLLRNNDRVTIIHGPNGVGKTVLLRLVSALLSGNLPNVIRVPFTSFDVTLSDGTSLGFRREINLDNKEKGLMGVLYLRRDDTDISTVDVNAKDEDVSRWATFLERQLPWLSRVDKDQFHDRRHEEVLSGLEVISRYAEYFPGKTKRKGVFTEPEWLMKIRSKVGVHLIETQRLLRVVQTPKRDWEFMPGGTQDYTPTVKNYAKDLQTRISDTFRTYGAESQGLDQTFPQRMIGSAVRTLTVEELKTKMQALEDKRQKLKRIRLIDDAPTYPFDITTLEQLDETKRTVLSLYVEDTERKLGAWDDLARRVEILLGNINEKFTHKSIQIDREKGLVAITGDNQILDLDALSSGEQHELVLLYDLLFRVKPNTLVLIDEPELSLHVTWQKSFLPELLEIVATTGFDVLLATHSPFIVGDRQDLMVALRSSDAELV